MVSATVAGGARTRPALGVAVERERIANELNRYAIHRLFGIGLKLQSLAVRGPDAATPNRIEDCVHELDFAIADLRRLIFELAPEMRRALGRSSKPLPVDESDSRANRATC